MVFVDKFLLFLCNKIKCTATHKGYYIMSPGFQSNIKHEVCQFQNEMKSYCLDLPPTPYPVANKGLQEFPTKDIVILVVTVTGRGLVPIYGTLHRATQTA